MILSPLPTTLGSWSDTDSDSLNDTWTDPNTSQATTLADLNLQNNDADNDGATNDEEAAEGSNPFSFDTDYDGISDGDELHLVKPLIGTSLTDWDSDDDEVSDYDEWYNFSNVTYPGGQLPGFTGASYSDYDGDGFKNPVDPFPTDPSNYASANGFPWYGEVFGDPDGDSIPNWEDSHPYDPNNGALDTDGDGITDSNDPYPNDITNYSSVNSITWNGDVSGDADGDGTPNWQDSEPYGPPTPTDADADGFTDDVDPYPNDSTNYSSLNSITWNMDVLGDADSDGTPNWQDTSPYPPADSDYDGIGDSTDPFPNDANNYAPINGTAWYADVFGDADNDGLLNWEDPTPSPPVPPDTDSDSIPDAYDPYPTDNANHSNINNVTWYTDVNSDNDGDGILNWTDPYPTDNTNFCALNNTAWHGNVLGDDDTDGYLNWQDHDPSPFIDQDGDGILNGQDPYRTDATNFSPVNSVAWFQDVLGDADSDGRPNYEDVWPYDPLNNPDRDGDGLRTSQETTYGTSDFDVDCDDDGLTDYEELIVYSTNPLNAHSLSQDRGWDDLYTDYQLANTTDTDSDTIPDRIELFYGMLPNDPADGAGDLDGNGMSNAVQYSAGLALNVDLNQYDVDSDGITDIFEDYYGLNKNSAADAMGDEDNDGVLNFEEAALMLSPLHANSRNLSGLTDLYLLAVAMLHPEGEPEMVDANNNSLPDWYDNALVGTNPAFTRVAPNDLDGDGMPDAWEHQHGRWKYPVGGLYVRQDDSTADPDSDALTNLQEFQIGTSPLIADSNADGTSDGAADNDGDGLTNSQEAALGSNANSADTDGDGMNDQWESSNGTNALGNDALDNLDGDDLTNEEEYKNNLDPQDGADWLVWQVFTRIRQGVAEPWGYTSFDPVSDPKHYRKKVYSGFGQLGIVGSDSGSEFTEDFLGWHLYEWETDYSRVFEHQVDWTEEAHIPIFTGYVFENYDPAVLPHMSTEYTSEYDDAEAATREYVNEGYSTLSIPHDWFSNGQDTWLQSLDGTYQGDGTSPFVVTGPYVHNWSTQDSDTGNVDHVGTPSQRQQYPGYQYATVPLSVTLGGWDFDLTLELLTNHGNSTEWHRSTTTVTPSSVSNIVTAQGLVTETWTLSEPITAGEILNAAREDLGLCLWTDWQADMQAYLNYVYYEDNGYAIARALQREYFITVQAESGATLIGIKPRTYRWFESYLPENGVLVNTPRQTTIAPGEQSQVFIMDPMDKDPHKSGEMILLHPGRVDLTAAVNGYGVPEGQEEDPGVLVPLTERTGFITNVLTPTVPQDGTYKFEFPPSVNIYNDDEGQFQVTSGEVFTYNPAQPPRYYVRFSSFATPQPAEVKLVWTGDSGYGSTIELTDTIRLLPIALKVTDFATKNDALPYSAKTSAAPPKNLELCLKADKTFEDAEIEIQLPSIADPTILPKLKWTVVNTKDTTTVGEGLFGGATPSRLKLDLHNGSSFEDEILFEVYVGAAGNLSMPAVKMNVLVVRDRLNYWFEPYSADFGWRTAKPESRADTGDYPDHKDTTYKRESLQSVYEFLKSTTQIASADAPTPKANWLKSSITCFGEFHEALKTANGNNPLMDLNSLPRIDLTSAVELSTAAKKFAALRSVMAQQTKIDSDANPMWVASKRPERVQWAQTAAATIGDPRITPGVLLALWTREGSMGLNWVDKQTNNNNYTAYPISSPPGAPLLSSADDAKIVYIYEVAYECMGSDFMLRQVAGGGAGTDNQPDYSDLAASLTYFKKQVDAVADAGTGARMLSNLGAKPTTPGSTDYIITANATFYEDFLTVAGMYFRKHWHPQGPDVTYMYYNLGGKKFREMTDSFASPTYPERNRLGIRDWSIHYEIRGNEWKKPRINGQQFHCYRLFFEEKYP